MADLRGKRAADGLIKTYFDLSTFGGIRQSGDHDCHRFPQNRHRFHRVGLASSGGRDTVENDLRDPIEGVVIGASPCLAKPRIRQGDFIAPGTVMV
ncbi:MAG: hypothetical protein P4L76_05295 [Beijerinckiaceae bacterium]|nr:hypothetical protein [Beijerinckiaceae bacterium]